MTALEAVGDGAGVARSYVQPAGPAPTGLGRHRLRGTDEQGFADPTGRARPRSPVTARRRPPRGWRPRPRGRSGSPSSTLASEVPYGTTRIPTRLEMAVIVGTLSASTSCSVWSEPVDSAWKRGGSIFPSRVDDRDVVVVGQRRPQRERAGNLVHVALAAGDCDRLDYPILVVAAGDFPQNFSLLRTALRPPRRCLC